MRLPHMQFQPRVIRAKDAHIYLGMDRNRFNHEVKPHLVAIPIGTQGIAYDRLDMDEWWEEYKRRNGRLGALLENEGEEQWEEKQRGSVGAPISQVVSGTSKRLSADAQFTKAVERVTKRKLKGT